MIALILLCMGGSVGCASGQRAEATKNGQDMAQSAMHGEAQQGEENFVQKKRQKDSLAAQSKESESGIFENPDEYSPEKQMQINEEMFYEQAAVQGIDRQEAEAYLQVLTDDNIFQNGVMELTGLRIGDMDDNGQIDMLVVVQNVQEKFLYGTGGLWFYMNEDEPYCFLEEDCPYFGWYSSFWADLDNDGHIEITFSAQGTGCGGTGDHYKAVFKYKNHSIARMQLPSDFEYEEEYCEYGLSVNVFQEPDADSYSAYCACLDEQISFRAENIEGWELPDTVRDVGGNVGGFFDLCVAEYDGKQVLQASEYLCGEGGITHGVAIAQFLITWEADNTPKVLKWWIEGFDNK